VKFNVTTAIARLQPLQCGSSLSAACGSQHASRCSAPEHSQLCSSASYASHCARQLLQHVRVIAAFTLRYRYKPKVTTWGVFPRPQNISQAYGGGRNIRPGQELETPEQKAQREVSSSTTAQQQIAVHNLSTGLQQIRFRPELETPEQKAQREVRLLGVCSSVVLSGLRLNGFACVDWARAGAGDTRAAAVQQEEPLLGLMQPLIVAS
jgi:hypothetical protein